MDLCVVLSFRVACQKSEASVYVIIAGEYETQSHSSNFRSLESTPYWYQIDFSRYN
jgi:DNA gyrase inhibitor GyrI